MVASPIDRFGKQLGFPLPPAGAWLADNVTPEAAVKAAELEFVTFKDEWVVKGKAEQWKLRRGVNLV